MKKRLLFALLLLTTVGILLPAASVGTQEPDVTVRIVARQLADGRVEFGLRQEQANGTYGETILPRSRFFPADAEVGRWLRSSPIDLTAAPRATPTRTPSTSTGDWEYFTGANVEGNFEGYGLYAFEHSGYDWQTPPSILIGCGGTEQLVAIGTPFLLFNDYNTDTITVSYRPASAQTAIHDNWISDEESDSTLWAINHRSFLDAIRRGEVLYVAAADDYDNEWMNFNTEGATAVLDRLPCF